MYRLQHQSSSSSGFDYIPTLDGWRALSVLGVILCHCATNGMLGQSLLSPIARRGKAGVDVFFAISGFLICGKLLEELERSGTISLVNFYLRRAFRILPAMLLYLCTLALLVEFGFIKTKLWEFGSSLLFVRNYFPLEANHHVYGAFTAQFWSLAVEEHFYLLCPLALLLLGRNIRKIRLAVISAILVVIVWKVIDIQTGWLTPFGVDAGAKTDTRIDALLWGCLAAAVYPAIAKRLKNVPVRSKLWIPLILAGAVLIFFEHVVAAVVLKAAVFPAMLMATAMAPESIASRFLELPVLRWIGRLSYGMYIWQQLAIFQTASVASPMRVLERFPLNIFFILAVACSSYYLVEQPLIRFGRRLIRRHRPDSDVESARIVRSWLRQGPRSANRRAAYSSRTLVETERT